MIHFFSKRLSYEYLYISIFSERVKRYYVLFYLYRIIFSARVKEAIAFEMTHFFFRRLRETSYEYLYRSTFSERVKRYYLLSYLYRIMFFFRVRREATIELIHFFSRRLPHEYLYRSILSLLRIKRHYVLYHLYRFTSL